MKLVPLIVDGKRKIRRQFPVLSREIAFFHLPVANPKEGRFELVSHIRADLGLLEKIDQGGQVVLYRGTFPAEAKIVGT